MSWLFPMVLGCIQHQHDSRLLILAALVCVVGVYAAFAVAAHSARSHGRSRTRWGLASVVAAGSTAWATHFIILLAFQPGLPVGFEPILTVTSLFSAMLGIGLGIALVLTNRSRPMRFLSGLVLGSGITTLHYLGQAAYSIQARVEWNMALVGASGAIGLVLCGWAMVFVASRRRSLRPLGAPLLLIAIAVIHFGGMAAMVITPDATVQLPSILIPDAIVTVTVASVSISLLLLAIAGWRMDLSAKRRLIMDRRRVRELADVALEGLLICHGDQIVTVNRSLVRLVGASEEALRGMRVGQVLPGLDPALLAEREEHDAVLTGADGSSLPVRVLRSEVILGHKPHTVIAVRDQRERLRTEAEMRALAYSDALTGLANRKRFTDLLDHEIRSTALGRSQAAILMLDLDSFKLINDTLGHHAGDEVLREVARRLDRLLEGLGVAARLGGDEFAILLPSTGRQVDLQGIAAQIMEALGASGVKVDGHSLSIAASLGGARGLEPSDAPEELMRRADLALYAAKADGRGAFRQYDAAMDADLRARLIMEDDLKQAIERGQFELHYQPLIDARSGQVCAAEALIRWRHPRDGLVSPLTFIPLAEETGQILQIGEWVLRSACAEAAAWPNDMQVAVNLSPAQFASPNLLATVLSALGAAGLDPSRLELEITEGVLMRDEERTLQTLTHLRTLGVRISMDDFGTGYSSLSYLRRYPFDKIKIDRSFVQQLPDDPEGRAIVRAILNLSHCLKIKTTVEGVETQAQYDFCVAEGVDTLQGYLISRPLPLADFSRLIRLGQDASHPFTAAA